MLSPFLLVGIGGSGGKTLRTARADLERRLAHVGWTEKFPDAWQFIHIDAPTTPDGFDPDLPGGLPSGSYEGLVGGGTTYPTIDSILTQSLPREINLQATGGWRPNPAQVTVPVDKGAGQYRALGRVITVTHLNDIKRIIEAAIGALKGPEVEGQLKRVAKLMGADPLQKVPDPVALLISSIAGGSGAGAVLDVAQTLRAAGLNESQNIAVLYAPDVFDGIPEQLRRGVRPNALATISELSAAYWNDEGTSNATNAVYNAKGVTLPPGNRTTPRLILVGRSNSHVDYRQQNSVYLAMGRALAAWVCSETVQDNISAYVMANEDSNTLTTSENFPAMLSHQGPPFRGVGFARVSLGRDLFGEYASQFLARNAVEVILRHHHTTRRSHTDDRTDIELIEDAANLAFRGFVKDCGLDERGEASDIVAALRPPDRDQRHEQLVGTLQTQVTQSMGNNPMDVGLIRGRTVDALYALASRYYATEDNGQREAAQLWTTSIQQRIMAAVTASVAHSGALIAQRMLRRLQQEEIPFLLEELRHEATEYAHWANDLDGAVQTSLAAAGSSSLPASNPVIADACDKAATTLYYRAEERLLGSTRSILDDLSKNFIEPLELAVDASRQRLADDEKPVGATPSPVSLWPMRDQVPSHLKQSANEFLLEETEKFPQRLREKLSASIAEDGAGDAQFEAVAQVISGSGEVGATAQQAIALHKRWQPAMPSLRRPGASPQRAQFRVTFDADHLLKRSKAWAEDRTRALGRYLAESLNSYLDDDAALPEELSRRLLKFEGQFSAAVRAAEPLVSIDRTMLQKVHGIKDPSNTFIFTVVPFGDEHGARPVTERVLDQIHVHESNLKLNYGDSDTGFIDVFSFMDTRYQPIVFDSLMKPIAEEWVAARMDADRRDAFWRWRRSRPLPEFIPAAPAVRRAMVRGWFTAALLGQLRDGERGLEIYDPKTETFAAFPSPLLEGDTSMATEIIPAVINSLPIAWLDAAMKQDLGPLAAYRRLRDLGSSRDSGSVSDYTMNSELEHWINSGDLVAGSPVKPDAPTTSDAREKAALDRLSIWKEHYKQVFWQVEKDANPYRTPRAYEMRNDIDRALEDLNVAVQAAETFAASRSDFI